MPTAICGSCGNVMHWRNQRGSKQPKTCSSCGGSYSKARYNYDTNKWENLDAQSKVTGRKFEKCALCGKRRTVPGGGRRVEVDTFYVGNPDPIKVIAGGVVCWWHKELDADNPFLEAAMEHQQMSPNH